MKAPGRPDVAAAASGRLTLGELCYIAAVYTYLYAPIAVLIAFSFSESRQLSVWSGFTLDWYVKAWANDAVIQSLRTSLFVALLTTAFSIPLGTAAAYSLGRHRFRGRSVADTLFYLPIIVPEIVIGFASVVFFGLIGWRLGFWSVVVAHVAFSISYVVYVVRARLAMLDPRLEEAAADLGATPLAAFGTVTLPLLVPGIVSAALLVFTISLDDYVITSFVAGRGGTTLPLQIYSMVRTGVTPEINAISTVLLLATIVLAFLSQRFESGQFGKGAIATAIVVVISLSAFAVGGPVRDAGKRELHVYIWSNYLPDDIVREFEERYDVRVYVELYESNEALLAKLQTGVTSYDIVVPSDYMVAILAKNQLLEPLDKNRLKNLDNLMPRFVGMPFDPENTYSIPYCWGTSGIGYRKSLVGHEITSWKDLWDPRLRDRVGMLNDTRENFAAALKSEGESLNTKDPETLKRAAALLKQQKPLVRTYDSDTFADSLLSGEVWVAQSYNGQTAKAANENPDIAYVVPVEGCTMYVDNLCVPKGSQNPDLALLFIDFILEGETSAAIVEGTGFATANKAAKEFLPERILSNPAIFPSDELLDRCELIEDVGDVIEIYERYWTEIKS